jgi:hypothetical protein
MGSVTYYVAMGFERSEEGDLVAMDPMESQSSTQAVSRARVLAVTKAGAVAFSRTGDPDIGERVGRNSEAYSADLSFRSAQYAVAIAPYGPASSFTWPANPRKHP